MIARPFSAIAVILSSAKGSLLIELLISVTVFALIVPPLIVGITSTRDTRNTEPIILQANLHIQEMKEAMRIIKATNWNGISNGTFYPTTSGTTWTLAANTQTLNNITRSLTISDVQRNSTTFTLLTSGADTLDPSTKRVTYNTSWSTPQTGSLSTTEYITRYANNTEFTRTTQAELNTGTFTQTQSTTTGEVQLSPGTGGSWNTPSIIGTFDHTGSNDGADVSVNGNYAHLVTSSNYAIINITTPATPTQTTTLAIGGTLNAVAASANTTYIASASDSSEVIAVNTTVKSAPVLGTGTNLTGTADGREVTLDNNNLYVGRTSSAAAEFVILSLTTPLAPTVIGSYDLGTNNLNAIAINGNTAYLATSNNTSELVILDITNKSAPSLLGTLNLPNTLDALDLFYLNNKLHVGTQNNNTGSEYYLVDVSAPNSPQILSSYNVGDNVNGIAADGNFALLSTDVSSSNFMVLDTSNPSTVTLATSLNINGSSNRVAVQNGYYYAANDANNQELVIIQGGVSTPYQLAGSYETSSFDAGASAGWNYLAFTKQTPTNTTLTAQIATNSNNTTWNYVGPDGTSATNYTTDGAIPLLSANARYARILFSFTSNGQLTPKVEDITLNYSP